MNREKNGRGLKPETNKPSIGANCCLCFEEIKVWMDVCAKCAEEERFMMEHRKSAYEATIQEMIKSIGQQARKLRIANQALIKISKHHSVYKVDILLNILENHRLIAETAIKETND